MTHPSQTANHDYVHWFRNSAPYINAFRGRTFVVAFGGEVVAEKQFASLVHDIALLNSLGVRLVLVHGARPQIEERLRERGAKMKYVNGLRVTDEQALACVKEATGTVRVEIEALLSMGLANSPMAGAEIRVASGNFVTAQPLGIRNGVDYLHTGEVRRIAESAVRKQLDDGAIVLLSPLGYSPTGEIFNLSAEDVATAAAVELGASKLIYLVDGPGLTDKDGNLVREISLDEAAEWFDGHGDIPEGIAKCLFSAQFAGSEGVRRAHLIDRHQDGSLLLELFTRDGVGTLVTAESYEDTRPATIDDVGGILELIAPLEEEGVLVRRSREWLEMEIDHFIVVERDGMTVASATLYPFPEERVGELACLAVHPDYRNLGRGDALLEYVERKARKLGVERLFVLTTRTAHWFQERGFRTATLKELPVKRQEMYNYQRRSKVFIKEL
ncbi:amino-acid N-acetyltransferase [Thiohalomonas denitrificans]|uniref:Amino-acid acetyltransferase n=1 Tax=Thiohalomonas denitrificans TaxID=415747 RepID=A0A1G5PMA9_9GAMM|nr:amino-acid N-acetyltransferase [Thiohalomonas denitrificans]SCZ50695.1 N-acetylglutamate synthase [Thiohalomonas denitrificans]